VICVCYSLCVGALNVYSWGSSRKRGQVFSAGFLSVSDEQQHWRFIALCPGKLPFLAGMNQYSLCICKFSFSSRTQVNAGLRFSVVYPRSVCAIPTGDEDAQPEITIAPNQKAFKAKARVDKLEGTYETDPAFTDFMAKLNKPPEKLSLAENVLDASRRDASSKEDLIKNNPLLKYMREKAERKLAERRSGKKGSSAKNLVVTGVLTKKSKQWVRACISHFARVSLLRFAPSW
jgi:hypothetical protein